jgi:hypothetical protein
LFGGATTANPSGSLFGGGGTSLFGQPTAQAQPQQPANFSEFSFVVSSFVSVEIIILMVHTYS